MGRKHLAFLLAAVTLTQLMVSGCAPRVIVRAHPGPHDSGIRYYRPKPYLKIEPAEVAVDKSRSELVPGMYQISLVYLPDFSEEYALDVKTGFGTAKVGIKLEDGWNLTEISQDLDSQTDENVKAIASLVDAIAPLATSTNNQETKDINFTVAGRNVPIGFYESVIGRDSAGCKRLYGFRYLGFVPFASCPLDVGGHEQTCCDDGQHPLYGLTFHQGLMQFEPLANMALGIQTSNPSPADQSSSPVSETSSVPRLVPEPMTASELSQLQLSLRTELLDIASQLGGVRATEDGDVVSIQIELPADLPSLAIQRRAEDWLRGKYGTSTRFLVQVVAIE